MEKVCSHHESHDQELDVTTDGNYEEENDRKWEEEDGAAVF